MRNDMHHIKATQKLNYILIIFLALIVHPGRTQTINSSFSYTDIYGNNITIVNPDKIPAKLDTILFKLNLTGLHFNKALTEKDIRYDYTISIIRQTKRINTIEFTLTTAPHTEEMEEILKYLGGKSHYKMTIKTENNQFHIDTVELMYKEI